jgi:diguanylate cyclase (GGDEF)-like protein/PAS domain S-box-containing protein
MSPDKKLKISNYKFSDLVDVVSFQKVLDSFFKATGVPNGLVSNEGKIITQSGWTNACSLFHRVNSQTNKFCLDSNKELMKNLQEGQIASSLCKNGLLDYTTPIVINGHRIATLFLGQVLNKSPDILFFKERSHEFNYNEKSYIQAIKNVPIIPKDKMESLMECMVDMAQILVQNGLSKLQRTVLEEDLAKTNNEKIHLSDILKFSPNGIGWSNSNGEIEYINNQFTKLFGYTLEDIPTVRVFNEKAYPDIEYQENVIKPWLKKFNKARDNQEILPDLEVNIRCKDGSYRHVLVRISFVSEKTLVNFSDITAHWKSEQRNRAHDKILEMVAKNENLLDILHEIVNVIESEDLKSICSILLLDKERKHLLDNVKNRLPKFYNDAINGIEIAIGAGSCGTAAFLGKRVIVEDILNHEYWQSYKEIARKANLAACWSEPIISSTGKILGTFAVYHTEVNTPDNADLERINFAANIAAIAIENRNNHEELEHQANSDYLTGLKNRRAFIEQAEVELYRSIRYGRKFSLIMFDIDHFKHINDTFGHSIGDLVLQEIANICRTILREMDIVGRIGGEEFAILLPETDILEATKAAERLRIKMSKSEVLTPLGKKSKFTASFGVVFADNINIVSIDELLNQADNALYKAKKNGRNNVVTI